jgi:tetratricopeptide (TPR) repeat protein
MNIMDAAGAQAIGDLVRVALDARRRGDRIAALAAFEAAAAHDPSRTATKVEIARELLGLGRLDEAEALLRDVLATEPHHVGAWIESAQVQRRRENHPGALAHFEAAAAIEPNHLGIKVELARELSALGRLDEADAILRTVRTAEPRNLGALVETGHLRRQRGDRAGSLAAFAAAGTIEPRHQGVKLELARDLRALDRLDEAEAVQSVLLDIDPGNVGALVERGHVRRRRADHIGAISAFEAASVHAPHNRDITIELVRDLQALDRLDDAETLLRKALDADPGHTQTAMQLGQLLRSRGDRRGALEAFRAAAARSPHRAGPLVELAREQWTAGVADEANESLRRALDVEPGHLGAMMVAAEHALSSGDDATALALARRANSAYANELGPYLTAARAAAGMLDRAGAAQWLDHAQTKLGSRTEIFAAQVHLCRQFRDHPAALSIVAVAGEIALTHFGFWMEATSLAISLGDFAAAERALGRAPVASAWEAGRVHFLRARFAEAQRDYPRAIAYYREALARGGAASEWHHALARCCLQLGDVVGTREHLERSIELDASAIRARGKSLHLSQNHIGQLLDEYILDRQIPDQLVEICKLPLTDRAPPLIGLVSAHPDQTAPAIMLSLTMRQTGIFRPLPGPAVIQGSNTVAAARRIPSQIIQFWHDQVPPPDVSAIMASWQDAHPHQQYIRFDNASAAAFLRIHLPGAPLQAFLRAQEPAQSADIFRLAYLNVLGGLFVDADDRCLAPIETYVAAMADFVAYQEEFATIGANFIGAAPGHPVIARALEQAVEAVNRGDHDMPWLSTGSGLLTRAFAQLVATPDSSDWLNRAVVLELFELQRFVGMHCPAQYKKDRQRLRRGGKPALPSPIYVAKRNLTSAP